MTKDFICNRGHINNYRVCDNRKKNGKVYKMRMCIPCGLLSKERNKSKRPQYYSNMRFGGNREIAIKRDGEKCIKCGITREDHKEKYGYDITVDHIDGRGVNTPKEEKNNNLDNLQTLCLKCHGAKDYKRRMWSAFNKSYRGPVLQVKDGKVIAEFKSSAIAARELGLRYNSLHRVLAKTRPSLYGYKWVYKKEVSL